MAALLSELRLYLCNHFVLHIPSRRLRMAFYRKVMGFDIGRNSTVFLNCRFDCAKGLTIGAASVINQRCRLDSRGGITLGNNVSISEEVCVLTGDHDPKSVAFTGRTRPVVIEDYVFIGTRAMVLPGVTVRRGAIVGAGAVVSKDVEALSIVGGVPTRVIGTRHSDLAYEAEYSRFLH
jgi:acetyltransferase-like isoleucine patch superfamily enzyme